MKRTASSASAHNSLISVYLRLVTAGDFSKYSFFLLHPLVGCARIFGSTLHFFASEVIFTKQHYGHLLRILHWCTDQAMTAALEKMDLTAAQGRILGFLAHQSAPPCPRDIEEEFHLTHPTVSGLLSRLEKKGFLELCPDKADRRCKRIHLLPKGWEFHETIHQTILTNESRMVRDFTEEEKAMFADLLSRAIANMGGSPCHSHPKEESNQ